MYSFRLSLFVHLNTEPTKYYRSQHYAPKIVYIVSQYWHHTFITRTDFPEGNRRSGAEVVGGSG